MKIFTTEDWLEVGLGIGTAKAFEKQGQLELQRQEELG